MWYIATRTQSFDVSTIILVEFSETIKKTIFQCLLRLFPNFRCKIFQDLLFGTGDTRNWWGWAHYRKCIFLWGRCEILSECSPAVYVRLQEKYLSVIVKTIDEFCCSYIMNMWKWVIGADKSYRGITTDIKRKPYII